MWDGFNKRKFPRVNLQCEITIHPDAEPAVPIAATTENLGIGGVCVILDQPLDRFANCRVRLSLNETLPGVDCFGRIVWMVPTKTPLARENRFDTGIEFLNLDPESANAIRQFLESRGDKTSPGPSRP